MQKWQFRLSRDEFDRRQKNWLRIATFVACLGGGAATQFLISPDAASSAFSAGIPSAAGELRILVFTSCFVIFAAILITVRHATRRVSGSSTQRRTTTTSEAGTIGPSS